jgi:uncharacterized protein (DUF2147 family)
MISMHRFPAARLTITIPAVVCGLLAAMANASNVAGFDVLLGNWVRPDGGYTITIDAVGTDGALDAMYANPNTLPFAQARASRDDGTISVFLELRAGGYNGSTYNLTYDPARDVLQGVYYQANAQEEYEVYFERANQP